MVAVYTLYTCIVCSGKRGSVCWTKSFMPYFGSQYKQIGQSEDKAAGLLDKAMGFHIGSIGADEQRIINL